MSGTKFLEHPETPFPIGVEYYRAPIPRLGVWDEDFARIQDAGFRIVRSFSYWNWMEPRPGAYELDDFDRLFDLTEKHGLSVWLDITLATAIAFMGATFVGLARAAFEEALAYCKGRVQGGKPISEHQLVQKKLFDMFIKVELARAYIDAGFASKAVTEGQAAVEASPADPACYEVLARAHLAAGDLEAAAAAAREGLSVAPRNAQLRELMERIRKAQGRAASGPDPGPL